MAPSAASRSHAGPGLTCPWHYVRASRRHRRPRRRDSGACVAACTKARAFTSTRSATSRSSCRCERRRTTSTACCSSTAPGSSASSQSRRRSFTSACSATTSSGSAGSRFRRRAVRRSRRGIASRRARRSCAPSQREAERLERHVHAHHDSRPAHALGLVLEGRRAVVQLAVDRRAAGDSQLRRRARALPPHPSRPLGGVLGRGRAPRGRRTRRSAAGSPSTAPSCSRTASRSAAQRSVLSPPWTAGRPSTATARSWTGTRGSAPSSATSCSQRYHEVEPQVEAEQPSLSYRDVMREASAAARTSPTPMRSGGRCPAGRCSRRFRAALDAAREARVEARDPLEHRSRLHRGVDGEHRRPVRARDRRLGGRLVQARARALASVRGARSAGCRTCMLRRRTSTTSCRRSQLGIPTVWINRLAEHGDPAPTRELHDLAPLPETLADLAD